jgi:glycosyltransferase involved in cell wall biosynthesis
MTAQQPWLSVIIPTYNGELYLPTTLDSILAQCDTDIECIIVDDGSTDSTMAIVERYRSKLSLKIIKQERLGNWVAGTNYGLVIARGEYACFLHQDDYWLEKRLRVMRDLISEAPEAGLLLNPSHYVDSSGKYLGLWRCPLPPFPKIISPDLITERLLIQNFISIPAPIFKRELALKLGGLDETLWYTSDWDFWLKIAASTKTLYYPGPLTAFRIHGESQTVQRSASYADFRGQLDIVLEKHLGRWNALRAKKEKIQRIAKFSNELNVTLAGRFHGQDRSVLPLILSFILLGPAGWFRYVRDSRVWERIFVRLMGRIRR